MVYPLAATEVGRDNDSLLNLLSHNPMNIGRTQGTVRLQQSFKTAGQAFQAIDVPTRAVIVQYGRGKEIVAELCASFIPAKAYHLLRQAQQYSVNVFSSDWQKLCEAKAIIPIQKGVDIFYLDEQYYCDKFGLSTEPVKEMETIIV
jgi:CRISPR-associated endonuclease/helicase Cas3